MAASALRPHPRAGPHMTISTRASSLALLGLLVSSAAFAGLAGDAQEGLPIPARTAQVEGAPVAQIAWLPDIVSNGTWWSLDATGSYDPDGFIVNHTWRIVIDNRSTYLYGMVEQFKFSALGLHKIFLTVRDDGGHVDDAFWAVYSIADSDGDSLPDWWEDRYWPTAINGLDHQSSGDDPDGDGHTNLEEYEALTDPTDPSSHPLSFWEEYWLHILLLSAGVIVVVSLSVRFLLKRHRELEKKKIEYAIEIDKELTKDLEEEPDEEKRSGE